MVCRGEWVCHGEWVCWWVFTVVYHFSLFQCLSTSGDGIVLFIIFHSKIPLKWSGNWTGRHSNSHWSNSSWRSAHSPTNTVALVTNESACAVNSLVFIADL